MGKMLGVTLGMSGVIQYAMNKVRNMTHERDRLPVDFKYIPTPLRVPASEHKYTDAVALYASTDLTIRSVAEKIWSNVEPSAHIGKHYRDLLFVRYGLDVKDNDSYSLKVKFPKGQPLVTQLKYKDSIETCGGIAYIETVLWIHNKKLS